MKRAVYAGSFDPLTRGHLWLIYEAAKLFDELIVAVATNPAKKTMFTPAERYDHVAQSVRGVPNIRVEAIGNRFVTEYAYSQRAYFLIRGVRNVGDFEYERAMRNVNGDLAGGTTTVFMMPPRELAEVSSSLVKGMVGLPGWEMATTPYVNDVVFRALAKSVNGAQTP